MADAYNAPNVAHGNRRPIDGVIADYAHAKAVRSHNEPDWRMAAAYCLPRQYNTWTTEGAPGATTATATRRYAFDNTGIKSLPKYVAIINALITPEGQRWHKLHASDISLMRRYEVRNYFDALNNLLFLRRGNPNSKFAQAKGEVYTSLGLYGMGPVSVTWAKPRNQPGYINYKAWHMKDVFVLIDDEGNVTHVFRRFFLNARQFKLKFPNDAPSRSVKMQLDKTGGPDEGTYFEFLQCLYYNNDHEPDALNMKRHVVHCDYVCVNDKEYVGDAIGYSSMPMLTPRVNTEAENPYGFSAAMLGLPALGGVSAMKKTLIKQGHKAVDPPLLANDDGVLSGRVDIRPGRVNYGGMSKDGKRLVAPIESGNFQVAEKLIEDERGDIEDSFFVKLFTILAERPEMTATQVVEEIGQKASLLAPTMGRLQTEWAGPDIEREVMILAEQGLLPPMPEILREAAGDYTVLYTSPMAKAMYNEDISGFMRWVEFSLNYAQTAQDPKPLMRINMAAAQPEIADFMNVPTRWVNSDDQYKAELAAHEQRTQQQQVVEQAPAIASVANAAMKRQGTSNAAGVSNA